MSVPSTMVAPTSDRDLGVMARTAVWVGLIATFIGGAIVYAGKAAEDRSAIIRWLFQVRELRDGVNIWDKYMFPNPPIFPITLLPLTYLEPITAAMLWYAFKVALTIGSILMCYRLVRPSDDSTPLPGWVQLCILALSFRPILSDLHHANNNLIILFLILSSLMAWRKNWDVLAGMALALAITYKVTPGLILVYFLWKGSWRAVVATFLGIGLFLLVVPSLVLGPDFNGLCLYSWWHRMLRPFVVSGEVGDLEINQSLAGVLSRYLTAQTGDGRYVPTSGQNFVSLDPILVARMIKVIGIAMVGALAFLCRTKTDRRDDPRLLGEFALVVLTMLIVSERSWKHHYVTMLLPYTYLVYRLWRFDLKPRAWGLIAGGLAASALLMLSTSTEIGGHFAGGEGHKQAQFYGMFLWAGVVLYGLTAWRVWVERDQAPEVSSHYTPMPHVLRKRSRRSIPSV